VKMVVDMSIHTSRVLLIRTTFVVCSLIVETSFNECTYDNTNFSNLPFNHPTIPSIHTSIYSHQPIPSHPFVDPPIPSVISINPSIYLSIPPPTYPSTGPFPSVYPPSFHLSIIPTTLPSIHPSIHPFTLVKMFMSQILRPSLRPSVPLSIRPSQVYLSVSPMIPSTIYSVP
jgi:hypothetical protein